MIATNVSVYRNSSSIRANLEVTLEIARDIRTEIQTLEDYLGVYCATDMDRTPPKYVCQDACEVRFPRELAGVPVRYSGSIVHPCDAK